MADMLNIVYVCYFHPIEVFVSLQKLQEITQNSFMVGTCEYYDKLSILMEQQHNRNNHRLLTHCNIIQLRSVNCKYTLCFKYSKSRLLFLY